MSALAERTDPFEVIADTRELTRPQWLELRRTGLGGSDAGNIMFPDAHGSPLLTWADKRGLIKEQEDNDDLWFGRFMEPQLRGLFAERLMEETGKLVKVEVFPYMVRSVECPWMLANLDGIVTLPDGSRGGLEIKTADRMMAKDWRDDEVPAKYYAQQSHYMRVMGFTWFYTFCLLGKKPVIRFVPRNEEWINMELVPGEQALWQMVQSGDMPAPSGFDADDEALSALYAGGGDTIILDDIEEILSRHVALKGEIKEREEERALIGQQIKVAMGNAKKGTAPGYHANWSRFPVKRIDVDRLRKEMPATAQAFTREDPSERFVVAANGKAKEA